MPKLRSPPPAPVPAAAQKLLLNKKNKDLLEPYEARAAAAVNYMRAVNPGVNVIAGPLNDPNVSTALEFGS